jgi:hypothetical protein
MVAMSSPNLRYKLERLVGPIGLGVVLFTPIIMWLGDSFKADHIVKKNPYSLSDIHLALIIGLLTIIYESIRDRAETAGVGDESKIIMNRNQSDYYEIWEEVRAYRDVEIDAVGHSFNTLWFNFIKKFLYEVISNEKHFDSVSIRLVSSKPNPGSYTDIREFYASLDMQVARKITISLSCVPSDTLFFTGLCVNKSALWLSIREPHTVSKINEHVREWRRNDGGTAEKMVNWFVGIADYLSKRAPVEILRVDLDPSRR